MNFWSFKIKMICYLVWQSFEANTQSKKLAESLKEYIAYSFKDNLLSN